MGDVADFYDDFATYELSYLRYPNQRHRRVHERLEALIEARQPKSALDVGCGIGLTAAWLARRVPDVVAVDISPRSIAIAEKLHARPVFRVAALPADPLPGGSYDLVTLIDVIEHFPRTELQGVFTRIDEVAGRDAAVAINLPSRLFALRGQSEQVIDEAVGVDQLVEAAVGIGMEPLLVDRYGVEFANQYVFCVFSRTYDVSVPLTAGLRDRLKNRLWTAWFRLARSDRVIAP